MKEPDVEIKIPITVSYYPDYDEESNRTRLFMFREKVRTNDDCLYSVATKLFKTERPTARQFRAAKRWIDARQERAVNALLNILHSHPILRTYGFRLYKEYDFERVRIELDDPLYPITWLFDVDSDGDIREIHVMYRHRVKCGDSSVVFLVIAEIWLPEIESIYARDVMFKILRRYLSP